MHVQCEQSKNLPISPSHQLVKDRLALSALCNSSPHPYSSDSSRGTSPGRSRLSQNLSSSSISSSRANAMSPPPRSEAVGAPNFPTSRRLPPISDLKLLNYHQRSAPENVAGISDGARTQIRLPAPCQLFSRDVNRPAPQSVSKKSYITSPYPPHTEHSYAPSFSASPPALSNSSYANPVSTNPPFPEAKSYVMTRRRWSPPKHARKPASLSPPPKFSQATSSHKRRTIHSQGTARVCSNCGVMQTRQWVRGENQLWLCHSCGQFWRKNGYSRPRALWNRPTFKRTSRKLKVTSHGVGDTRRTKSSTRQIVSSSFLDGKKMIELETCLSGLHRGSAAQNAVNDSDGLKSR